MGDVGEAVKGLLSNFCILKLNTSLVVNRKEKCWSHCVTVSPRHPGTPLLRKQWPLAWCSQPHYLDWWFVFSITLIPSTFLVPPIISPCSLISSQIKQLLYFHVCYTNSPSWPCSASPSDWKPFFPFFPHHWTLSTWRQGLLASFLCNLPAQHSTLHKLSTPKRICGVN